MPGIPDERRLEEVWYRPRSLTSADRSEKVRLPHLSLPASWLDDFFMADETPVANSLSLQVCTPVQEVMLLTGPLTTPLEWGLRRLYLKLTRDEHEKTA